MMSTIANRIKEGLSFRNLKQSDLVEKTKISKGALSSYISGKYKPKQNNIYLIAKALDVSEAWLMGADVPMARSTTTTRTFLESEDEETLISSYRELSPTNKKKSVTYTKNLLSTQQMEEELLAAHARTDIEATPEGVQNDLDIMDDDRLWD